MADVDYSACTPADRAEAIEQLGALLSATTAELLRVITAADAASDWKVDGATGMAAWLVGMLRVSPSTARDWVRAGAQLAELPALHAALGEGRLSWDQARPAARFATPETDATLAQELPGCSATQIEALAVQRRARRTDEEAEAARVRRLRWRADHVDGGFRYGGFLPTELGEHVNQVLTRMAEGVGPDPETGLWAPFEVRVADALVELSRVRMGLDADPDTCLAVLHVDADVATGESPGNGTIGTLPICSETVQRLLCDTKIELALDGRDGVTVGIGRADRNVPRWLRRVVANRDGVCRFPGCGRQIRHRHHIQHWTRQGPTNASNLVGVCWHHHHLVHEGGWTVEGHPDGELSFVGPSGRRLSSRPRPIQPRVRRRARAAAGLPDASPTEPS